MNDASTEFNKQLELDVLVNGLTEITDDYVDKFNRYSFDEVIIPDGITTIGFAAFYRCINLKSITIPNSVLSIGNNAFDNCIKLANITISDRVTRIGSSAFLGCGSLISITIPQSVEHIGYWAFSDCNNLTNIKFEGRTKDEVRYMVSYPLGISLEKTSVQVS